MSIYAVNGKAPIAAWIPSRDTAGNGTTTLTDLVGSNNGTLTDMDPATDWVADTGAGGIRALDFDGTDDYVNVADNDALSFGNGTTDSPFSVSLWMNPTLAAVGVIAKSSGASAGEWHLFLGSIGNFFARCIDNSSGAAIGRETSLGKFTTGWQHVVVTYSGSGLASGIKIFRNTIQVDVSNSNLGSGYVAMENTSQPVTIAVRGAANFLTGRLDDIRIFPQVLNSSDISYLYKSGDGRGIITASGTIQTRRRRQLVGYGL